MWSHYANAHRGVCLMYEFPNDYFMEAHPPDGRALFFVGGLPVTYGDNAFSDWLLTGDLDSPHAGAPAESAFTKLLSSKGKAWTHEEEFRIVTSKPGPLPIDPTFLKQVTFGLAISDDHKRLITQLATRNNKDVVLAPVSRSPASDFGLHFP